MDTTYVTKWAPGQPTYRAPLPAPEVCLLNGRTPALRLMAAYFPLNNPPATRIVGCRLHLDVAGNTDPLGQPYWQPLDNLDDSPEGKITLTLMHHLAKALGIPTAREVEAGLHWEEVPKPGRENLEEAV